MRGRWAAGIVPRNFAWIIQDRLAVSERPGGHAPQHRRVRRQEEIIWLKAQGFDRVISLLPSNHNLHAYEERDLPSAHFPLPLHADARETLAALYPALLGWLRSGERLIIHQDELGERVSGVIAGFLFWSRAIPDAPRAISAVERLLGRQMGSAGRTIVAVVNELPPPPADATAPPIHGAELHAEDAPPSPSAETEAEPEAEAEVEQAAPAISLVKGGGATTTARPRRRR